MTKVDPFAPKTLEDLTDADLQALQKQYPGLRLPVPIRTPEARAFDAEVTDYQDDEGGLEVHVRGVRVRVVIALVAVLGWAFMGLGWLVTEVGQGLWHIGKRMHEDKWRIG